MPGIPWPVNVYYQPPLQTEPCHSRENITDQPRLTFQGRVGHQPTSILFDTGAMGVAYINPACCKWLGLTPRMGLSPSRHQQRRLNHLQQLARATGRSVDPTEFSTSDLDVPHEDVVVLADGTTIPAQGVVHIPLTIQGYKETIPCVVINLVNDYDIILGDA